MFFFSILIVAAVGEFDKPHSLEVEEEANRQRPSPIVLDDGVLRMCCVESSEIDQVKNQLENQCYDAIRLTE